jgi:murein L,D-transpeptidase YcbB/YkuD
MEFKSGKVMKTNRRHFLASAGALMAGAWSSGAFAQNAIDQVLGAARRGTWTTQFDARGADNEGRVATNLPIFSPQTTTFVEMAIQQYQQIVSSGGWPEVPSDKKLQLGVSDPAVAVLRKRLMISGDLPTQAGISPAFDSYVDAAAKRFQLRHGLPGDGVLGKYSFAAMNVSADMRLGQLQTNLGRLSAVGDLGPRYVVVNIPAAQIEAVENGKVVSRHTAIVGKIDRQTPLLNSRINEIIINPYWNAPVSIVRRDIIPIMRKDPTYLTDNNIHLLAPDGKEVDPTTIDWSTDDATKYRFRQDPGKINAMASVKINFPSPDGVYMHDTPEQSLFNQLMRFDSSGCVRVQNVRDLVTWLMRGTAGWDRQRLEDTIKSGVNTPVELTDPTPVHFVYITAWSTGPGVVQFRNDVYGRDGAQELKMSSAI